MNRYKVGAYLQYSQDSAVLVMVRKILELSKTRCVFLGYYPHYDIEQEIVVTQPEQWLPLTSSATSSRSKWPAKKKENR